MSDYVRVDLHCHSSLSDGQLLPEQIAQRLSLSGVSYAALTDHDSIEGQAAFRQAASHLGIGSITGIELTTWHGQQEVHLLGYGFSPDYAEFTTLLPAIRPPRNATTPEGTLPIRFSTSDGIALLHKAGGIAVLAHPLKTAPDEEKCRHLIESLHQKGLDGIEAFRPDQASSGQEYLTGIAERLGLVMTGGTDAHFNKSDPPQMPGIPMNNPHWKAFRDTVLSSTAHFRGERITEGQAAAHHPRNSPRFHWQSFVKHIVFPMVLALVLFAGVLLFAVLPAFENALLDRKREMIKELTNAAWSVLLEASVEEKAGLLSGAEARAQAIKRIETMRYGRERKDYFWLQDTTPRMIMHPYRKDLNGTNLTDFTDPLGRQIFVQFAKLVKEKKEGYVNYVWQWKDDPTRLEPKESYIRLFEPWGWIIGTGIYTHDVKEELARLEHRLALFSAGIILIVTLLLVYVMRSSLQLERKRVSAEELLRETTQRYKTLVDAATEGMLFISDTRCKYANPLALELTGYSQNELELLDINDILPNVAGNAELHAVITSSQEKIPQEPMPGVVRRRDGQLLECLVTLQPSGTALKNGFLLLLRRINNTDSGSLNRSQGVLGKLLKLPAAIAHDIREELATAVNEDEIISLCLRAPSVVQSLLDNGASATEIARMLSSVTDAATKRLITLWIDSHGEPPVPFVFVALGSQGRMEQTLFTDQDNAIIYNPAPDQDLQSLTVYFNTMSEFVCNALSRSGYHKCNGKIMANNPQWCQPVSVWKELFNTWIQRAELKELMEFSIFFDFRAVYGEESLTRALRTHVLNRVQNSPRFFTQAAQNALQFKSPFRLFGMVVSNAGKGENAHYLDLKAATMPIVSFIRLYSLQQGITETNSSARIDELVRSGVLLPSQQDEIMTAYALLLRLRLRHQSAIMQSGGQPDNLVDPAIKLTIGTKNIDCCDYNCKENNTNADWKSNGHDAFA